MALINCSIYSEALGFSTSLSAIIPEKFKYQEEKHPVLYLLHGFSGSSAQWTGNTSVARYASEKGIAVIMPDAGRSYYADMVHGYKYWTYISEELPKISKTLFPLSDKREDTFVAGLSMGGYGAFKLAFSNPERFAAVGSFAGPLDVASLVTIGKIAEDRKEEWKNTFGDVWKVAGSPNDLFFLLQKMINEKVPMPAIYQSCGTEDFIYENNQSFRRFAESINLKYTYDEGPGSHNFDYWDTHVKRFLNWILLGTPR